ncbi:MAG: hypothetical protein NTZ05_00960 [Chloroflexi bacterium]|nr:hypothetical protein [Chloroflexota bacterium]
MTDEIEPAEGALSNPAAPFPFEAAGAAGTLDDFQERPGVRQHPVHQAAGIPEDPEQSAKFSFIFNNDRILDLVL